MRLIRAGDIVLNRNNAVLRADNFALTILVVIHALNGLVQQIVCRVQHGLAPERVSGTVPPFYQIFPSPSRKFRQKNTPRV